MVADLQTSKSIVENYFPDADEPVLQELLIQSAGVVKNSLPSVVEFRPWWVSAHLILTHYRKLSKADVVTFVYEDPLTVATNLLDLQGKMDKDLNIPDGFSVGDTISNLIISVQVHG